MGANTFTAYGRGSNAVEAFQAAKKQAQYDHGHAGYSGTIAEKSDVTLIDTEPLSVKDASALAEKLVDINDDRVADKWGPAGAIPVDRASAEEVLDGQLDHTPGTGDQLWLFFGWASS